MRWRPPHPDDSGGWKKAVGRIFGVQARFYRMTDCAGMQWQRLSFGDVDLQAHQIESGHQLRHRMLHLNASVYFDEIEFAGRSNEELNGARVGVSNSAPDCKRLRRTCAHAVRHRLQETEILQ